MNTAVISLVVVLATAAAADRDPSEFSLMMDKLDAAVKDPVLRWRSTADRCTGDRFCCTSRNRCGLGEGHCEFDCDCLGETVCGEPGNCLEGIHVPTYQSWRLDVPTNFSKEARCCQLDPEVLEFLETYEE